jgi:hypothetical protein
VIAVSAAAAAAVLLALAISSQIRFGPRISEVPKTAPSPPAAKLSAFFDARVLSFCASALPHFEKLSPA